MSDGNEALQRIDCANLRLGVRCRVRVGVRVLRMWVRVRVRDYQALCCTSISATLGIG